MARKVKEAGELEENFDDLDDISETVVSRGFGGGARRDFPEKLAEVLKEKYDRDCTANECLAIPKEWLEGKLGFDTSKPMKGRPNAIKRKLNTQHGDMVGDLHIWHVGNKNDNFYTISVLEVNLDAESKWKHPVRKKKESEPSGDE